MSDFKKLKVWRKAYVLALRSYRLATSIRGSDNASLRNQIIRAAMSVPTNIVEGAGQRSRKDFGRFLGFALNSATELEHHLLFARDIGVISVSDFETLSARSIEVQKMLHGLRNRVMASAGTPSEKSVRTELTT
ncbi:MAG: four helix bundle protein [Gemmatimonadaceae bacterium]